MGLFLKILFTIICFEMTSYNKKNDQRLSDIHYYVISIVVQSVETTCVSVFQMTEDDFDVQSTSEGPCHHPEGRQGK